MQYSTPVFKIGTEDFAQYIAEVSPGRNDLDADGSGRNILIGKMYRNRLGTKLKFTIKMLPVEHKVLQDLEIALWNKGEEFVEVSMYVPFDGTENDGEGTSADTFALVTKTFYCSTVQYGQQVYIPNYTTLTTESTNGLTSKTYAVTPKIFYVGAAFDLIEQ